MSIDVFGRKLERAGGGSRGPPGIGFKLTEDKQYDIDGKRMCNVASPNELGDAVNLAAVQRIVSAEIQTVKSLIEGLRNELKNLDALVEDHRVDIETMIRKLHPKKSFDKLLSNSS